MTLRQLIERLSQEDLDREIPIGFCNPYSYRGDYSCLAFEIAVNTTVGQLLSAAEYAVDREFEGWKGGIFKMTERTTCYLVKDRSMVGIEIDEALLERLLANFDRVEVNKRECKSSKIHEDMNNVEKSGYVLAMRLLQSDLDLDDVEINAIAQFTTPDVMRRVLRSIK